MGTLSNELSSWRKNIVECPAGEVTTLNFRDTRPNVMLVMNPTEHRILCNLDSIPTEEHYDFVIKNHYARLVGKPVATSQVYFLNTGNESVTLQVYSIFDKNFDPSWLSDFSIENVNIDSETVKPIVDAIKGNTQVEITGYTGTDKIPVYDSDINVLINRLISVGGSTEYRNLASLCSRLEQITGATTPGGNGKTLNDLSILLSNINGNITTTNQYLNSVFNKANEINDNQIVLAGKLDTIITKLNDLIAK